MKEFARNIIYSTITSFFFFSNLWSQEEPIFKYELEKFKILNVNEWQVTYDTLGNRKDSSITCKTIYNKNGQKVKKILPINSNEWDTVIYIYNKKGYLVDTKEKIIEATYLTKKAPYTQCKKFENGLIVEETFSSMEDGADYNRIVYFYNADNLLYKKNNYSHGILMATDYIIYKYASPLNPSPSDGKSEKKE